MAFSCVFSVFFFNDTATTEIYTLSLYDALPISPSLGEFHVGDVVKVACTDGVLTRSEEHTSELQSPYVISYAVFCLQKQTTIPATGTSFVAAPPPPFSTLTASS